MTIVLNTDQQIVELTGGDYVITTTLNGGTASLHVAQYSSGSPNWIGAGALTATPQVITVPSNGSLRLTKTGAAIVELSTL